MPLDRSPVYVVVDPAVHDYHPVLAAYPNRDVARQDLPALVTMSQTGHVQIREFTGKVRTATWGARKDVDGTIDIQPVRRD
ncbi:hypothetical protein [Pseudactinotalea terrae]|uniref:hypothetical protein n=1 Tax=Pseudactinotalea terrae TaxID=1743262 RepID=UPI0012E1D9D9|nr:hypothetical protein [Pseudactinotalea terrae]